jgi:hypothetical protein
VRADVDAWRAWQLGRAYEDMGLTHVDTVLRVRDMAGGLGHAAVNGWAMGKHIRQYRALEAAGFWPTMDDLP